MSSMTLKRRIKGLNCLIMSLKLLFITERHYPLARLRTPECLSVATFYSIEILRNTI
jgi:hypothetical protein